MIPKPPSDAEQKSKTQEAEVGARCSLWAELGLAELDFLDESSAPEIDEPLLRRLVRQELPENVARAVYRLIYSYASWHHAHAKIMLDEFNKSRQAT